MGQSPSPFPDVHAEMGIDLESDSHGLIVRPEYFLKGLDQTTARGASCSLASCLPILRCREGSCRALLVGDCSYRPKWRWNSFGFFIEESQLFLPIWCTSGRLSLFVGRCRQLTLGEELRGADVSEQGCPLRLERQRCFEHPEQFQ